MADNQGTSKASKGPLLTSTIDIGSIEAIPQMYQPGTVITQTDQEVQTTAPLTIPVATATDVFDGKQEMTVTGQKKETHRDAVLDLGPHLDQEYLLYHLPDRQVGTSTHQLVPAGGATDTLEKATAALTAADGFVKGKSTNLGNGFVDQEITRVALPRPVLVELPLDHKTKLLIRTTKQVVAANPEPTDAGWAATPLATSTATSTATGTLNDTTKNFTTLGVVVGDVVKNTTTGLYGIVSVVATTALTVIPYSSTSALVFTSGNGYTVSSGTFVEYQSWDKYWSIRLSTRAALPLPPKEIYATSHEISLPDLLTSLEIGWDDSSNTGTSVNGGDQTVTRTEVSASQMVDGSPIMQVASGFRGLAKARLTRTFSLLPPQQADLPTPTTIKPAQGTVIIRAKGQSMTSWIGAQGTMSAGGGVSTGTRIQVKGHVIGPILTNGVTMSVGSITFAPSAAYAAGQAPIGSAFIPVATAQGSGIASWNVTASTPASFTSGDVIIAGVAVYENELGVYVTEVLEVFVP